MVLYYFIAIQMNSIVILTFKCIHSAGAFIQSVAQLRKGVNQYVTPSERSTTQMHRVSAEYPQKGLLFFGKFRA